MEREGRSTARGERGRSPSLPRRSSPPPPRRSSSPPSRRSSSPPSRRSSSPPQTAPRSPTAEEIPDPAAITAYFDSFFGPSPNRTPPVSSSTAYFDSVFGPSSTGRLRDHHTPVNQAGTSHPDENHDYIRTTTPWPYASSIYYGGQDVIVFPKNKKPPPRNED
ncbi:unnamed protein product [Cuscuta epithymum]|uniref:Uncharacterized protein n=1 Tax=Cuscuta epithymum TaxID=186058 RepID=A0AAV0DCJ6_9ASTE|nr:unnamed protein product [Cuscuta epithymum]CAH9138331.1 unnamed protein product [Cuscuta epithymum]